MKFIVEVRVNIRQQDSYQGQIMLGEERTITLNSLSDAAGTLVKLHELFEALIKMEPR